MEDHYILGKLVVPTMYCRFADGACVPKPLHSVRSLDTDMNVMDGQNGAHSD